MRRGWFSLRGFRRDASQRLGEDGCGDARRHGTRPPVPSPSPPRVLQGGCCELGRSFLWRHALLCSAVSRHPPPLPPTRFPVPHPSFTLLSSTRHAPTSSATPQPRLTPCSPPSLASAISSSPSLCRFRAWAPRPPWPLPRWPACHSLRDCTLPSGRTSSTLAMRMRRSEVAPRTSSAVLCHKYSMLEGSAASRPVCVQRRLGIPRCQPPRREQRGAGVCSMHTHAPAGAAGQAVTGPAQHLLHPPMHLPTKRKPSPAPALPQQRTTPHPSHLGAQSLQRGGGPSRGLPGLASRSARRRRGRCKRSR